MSATETSPAVDERPRFEDAWESTTVAKSVSTPVTDGPHSTPDFLDDGVPFLSVNNVVDNKLDFADLRYISRRDDADFARKCKPVRGDILMGKAATVGTVAIVDTDLDLNIWSPLALLRFGPSFIPRFAYYALLSEQVINQIRLLTNSSSQGNLGMGDISKLILPLPPLPEQRAIAAALSDVDDLLQSLDRLIAKKRDVKQGAMQQLLTGTTRLPGFEGAWETKRLGDLGTFFKGSGIKKDEVRSEGLACVRYGEIYTSFENWVSKPRSFISESTARQATAIANGDLLFAASGETAEEIGKCIAYFGTEPAFAGGDIVVMRPSESCDATYLGCLLNTPEVASQKSRLGQGHPVAHIGASALGRVVIPLPPLPEQRAIAAALRDVDAEIDALEARRSKVAAIKQGMMQELLTGRTRLPIPEEAIDA